ncbi:glycopeptide [Thelephora ganbajun]|uniref:Glycopeptide n=1 Tax=Thelephora ganbajun TaxID=370292 RepID=A0ACB6ZSN8_THEGA|nr:glycopeptide [Thelephora ganbajun]
MLYRIFTVIALTVAYATAERHTVSFDNRCGHGTPTLVSQHGQILSTGKAYVSYEPLIGAIAYLQTKNVCGLNGDHCTTVETTLKNPTCPGCGSSTDITLIPPHTFSVTTGFTYHNGCDGAGATCNNANCPTAFHESTDTWVQVACQANDVNLIISFCA